jgi:hypothetical protein
MTGFPVQLRFDDEYDVIWKSHPAPVGAPHVHGVQPRVSSTDV